VVEELFPASVAVVAEVDVDERVVSGLDGFSCKLHPGMLWNLAAFLDVTRRAGAHYIFPYCFAAHSPRDNVVER
jgi:hypothetical protein